MKALKERVAQLERKIGLVWDAANDLWLSLSSGLLSEVCLLTPDTLTR